MNRQEVIEYAEGLVEMGRFLLSRPEMLVDEFASTDPLTINVSCLTPEELASRGRTLGSSRKYSEDDYTGLQRSFGPHVIDVFSQSSRVCRPKRTEARQVPVVELTDEARAQINAIREQHTRIETQDVVVAWDCPPSLLAPGPSDAAAEEVAS